jgi:hypothetical protein
MPVLMKAWELVASENVKLFSENCCGEFIFFYFVGWIRLLKCGEVSH